MYVSEQNEMQTIAWTRRRREMLGNHFWAVNLMSSDYYDYFKERKFLFFFSLSSAAQNGLYTVVWILG